jgi:hypothetical protein
MCLTNGNHTHLPVTGRCLVEIPETFDMPVRCPDMEIDSVPCAVCGDRVQLDQEHAELNVEYVASDNRPEEYVAHVHCVSDFHKSEP